MKNFRQTRKNYPRLASLNVIMVVAVCSAITVSASSQAQSLGSDAQADMETLVVSATRTEKNINEVAATVSVINSEQIERELANDIGDLVRYEPGVSVAGGGRFGLSGFNIRGISGDRVLTLVDSTPTADEFSFGPFLSSRRDFVDLDALKSVEIVRGPSSSSFGSNALGGVVNFITKDPVDYLLDGSIAGSLKVNYGSVDNSSNATLLTAIGSEQLSAMLVATSRTFEETESFFSDDSSGPDRRSENPLDGDSQNVFLKALYAPSEQHRLALTLERFNAETETDVLSSAGTVSRGVLVQSEQGVDERDRSRVSLNYNLYTELGLFDELSVLAYSQSSDAEQVTRSARVSFETGPQSRIRSSFYEQENIGLRVQANKNFELGASKHKISYGVDIDESDSATLRSGSTLSLVTNSPVREFSSFPTRDFPLSKYTSRGFFVQDDISLLEGRLNLIPSLRYDNFKLEPQADDVYLSGNPGSPLPEGYDESQTSLKLGALYNLSDSVSIFAQYAEGFRAPALDAVNVGFTNFAGGYTTLPNPNLRPERGEGYELGMRYLANGLSMALVAYRNDYEDFIESLAARGFNPATRLLEFQARNLPEARIEGLEFKLQSDLGVLSPALSGFDARMAYALSSGENRSNGSPINSIDPQKLVLGFAYTSAQDSWGAESVITVSDGKELGDIDTASLQERGAEDITAFTPPSYATLDLIAFWNVSEWLRVNVAAFNVTDKNYFAWSEELVQNPTTTNFDRLTQAGRNFSVSVKYQF